MSDNLDRFRAALAGIAQPDGERGLCAYSHPGPCQWPEQDPPMTEIVGDDGATWVVEYKENHGWAILWGGGRNVVRAWPPLGPDVPCSAPAGDLEAARVQARRIARLIVQELGM